MSEIAWSWSSDLGNAALAVWHRLHTTIVVFCWNASSTQGMWWSHTSFRNVALWHCAVCINVHKKQISLLRILCQMSACSQSCRYRCFGSIPWWILPVWIVFFTFLPMVREIIHVNLWKLDGSLRSRLCAIELVVSSHFEWLFWIYTELTELNIRENVSTRTSAYVQLIWDSIRFYCLEQAVDFWMCRLSITGY